MRIRGLSKLIGASLLFVWAGLAAADGGLEISGAWIRRAPPAVKVHAGYLTIANKGAAPRRLVGAVSGDYAKVELHTSRVTHGVATMEPVAQVEIAPGQAVSFMPGGLHLMLIGPKTALQPGSTVSLTLVFDDGTRLPVTATVKRNTAQHGKGHQGHGSHHGH